MASPKILVVGGGAREHAILHALARSPQRPQLLCAPGNAGHRDDRRLLPVGVDESSVWSEPPLHEQVDLVVVGPEAPLVAGLADALAEAGRRLLRPDPPRARSSRARRRSARR